ncbi:MAG: META domain-containing protein [Anaerolineae bacterium]|nr:META domain-containing protein [Anaerolineae bacterium]
MLNKTKSTSNNQWTLFSVLGLLFAFVIIFAACSGNTATPVIPTAVPPVNTPTPAPVVVDINQLYTNPWVLVGYGDPANPTVIAGGVVITLEFSTDGFLSGFSGCNNYSGSFQAATDGTLTISPLATTMMACSTGMDQESVYLTALQSAQSVSFDSQGRLVIKYSNPSQPDLVLIYSIGAKPLTDTNWILVSYGNQASPTPVPAGAVITAVFSPEGSVSGFSGCNHYNAGYSIQDSQITISTVAMTQMACETGMEIESSYLTALGTAQEYSISGQQLLITYDEGAGVLTFTSASVPLEYSLWTLLTINGEPVATDINITAVFTPGKEPNTGDISGSSGCNNYNAGYTLDGNNITVQPAGVTMMFCEKGMETEQAYLDALQASESYQILGNILVLTNPSGSLTYIANRTPLAGALWRLVSLGDVKNPVMPVAGSNFAAQFTRIPGSPSGILLGTTGCNEYSAAFAASTEEIKINLPVSTQNTSCVPGLAGQEQLYYLALNDATTFRISGNTLVIPYDSGKQELVFEGAQIGTAVRPPLSDLNGTTWFLWFLNNTPITPGTSIYAKFAINPDGASGTINGSAGCNNYVANFGLNMGVQTTLNANQVCRQPAGIMDQEGAYINMLSRAFGYWQTGNQLIINTGLGVLTYRTSRPDTSADQTHLLVGRTWYLVSYNNSRSQAGDKEPFTLFNADGTLTGYSGCNSFQGTYTTNILGITISQLNSTKTACTTTALTAQEQALYAILTSARSYQVADMVMQLSGDQGVLNYSLTPVNRPEEIIPPQAVIKAPGEANTGQVVRFDGSSSTSQVPIVSWQWDFGDGETGTGAVVDHVYKSSATYSVVLTITDERRSQSAATSRITIAASAAPTQTPPEPQPTPESTGTPEPTQPVQPTATVAPTEPPEVSPPQAVISGPGSGFVGEPISFDASASVSGSSPIVSYSWNFGDGTSTGPSSSPSQTTIYNQSGSYQVSVVVTDENGQSSSATVGVSISTRLDTPVVWILDSYDNQRLLPGTAITLQFREGEIAGFAGCNSYTGRYTAEENQDGTYSVTVTNLTTTSMACPTDIMDQESNYLTILPSVLAAQIERNVLSLDYPSGRFPNGNTYPDGRLIYYEAGTTMPR